jgi:hypothetical protein
MVITRRKNHGEKEFGIGANSGVCFSSLLVNVDKMEEVFATVPEYIKILCLMINAIAAMQLSEMRCVQLYF